MDEGEKPVPFASVLLPSLESSSQEEAVCLNAHGFDKATYPLKLAQSVFVAHL